MALNKYPTIMMPTVQVAMNSASNFGLTAFFSIIMEGNDRVVTPIINDSTVPS